MKTAARIGFGALVVAMGGMGASAQLALPCESTFDSDTVGLAPAMGVAHSPTGMLRGIGTEPDPIVMASSLGIVTQPVEFAIDPDPEAAAYLVYDFAPNVATLLRVEVTVSLSTLANVNVLRTWEHSVGSVVGDIHFMSTGQITGVGGSFGTYTPGVPVRLRMDVNIIAGRYAAAVDDELNGFGDDPVVTGLAFMNDPSTIDNVGGVGVGYNNLGDGPTGATVAVDDVMILEIPSPGTAGLGAAALALVLWRRR